MGNSKVQIAKKRDQKTYNGIVVAVMTTRQWLEWEFQRDVLFFLESIMCASLFFKVFHGYLGGPRRGLPIPTGGYLGEEAMGNNRTWADGDVVMVFCDGDTRPLEWHDGRAINEEIEEGKEGKKQEERREKREQTMR